MKTILIYLFFCLSFGESLGIFGSLLVVSLFVALLVRVLLISKRQHSLFAKIYGLIVALLFLFHFAFNVGISVNVVPSLGISLPFFSYMGSSLIAFTVLLLVFVKIDADRLRVL